MAGVNKVILVGNLGRDPEVRYTKAGRAVASFCIACNESWKKDGEKQERVEFVRIVAWGKLAEICGEFLKKGKQVYIEGRLQTRDWDDKDGNKRSTTEIVASTMTMLGQTNGNASAAPASSSAPSNSAPASGGDEFEDDSDIPF